MSDTPREWKSVLEEHRRVMAELDDAGATLDAMADAILACFRGGGRVYVLGNGGSAADAQHIAAELLGRFKRDRAALPAVALTTDSSCLTAIGNDLGFENVFARQVEGLVRVGDVVWLLSTSGNSPNVIAAARVAKERGALLLGFTGESGGELAEHCTHAFRAPHTASERIQEAHCLAYHYVCERVERGV